MKNKQAGHAKRINDTKAFIRQHWEENHYSPTIKEIAVALGGISTNTVSYYLRELRETGWLECREQRTGRGYGAARNIVPAEIFADRPVFPSGKYYAYDPKDFQPVYPKIEAKETP